MEVWNLVECDSAPSDTLSSLCRFVKLCVLPEKSAKMKTAVKKNTTDPVFNEVLKVKRKSSGFDPMGRHHLTVSAW